jgi:hypothetical protein
MALTLEPGPWGPKKCLRIEQSLAVVASVVRRRWQSPQGLVEARA